MGEDSQHLRLVCQQSMLAEEALSYKTGWIFGEVSNLFLENVVEFSVDMLTFVFFAQI